MRPDTTIVRERIRELLHEHPGITHGQLVEETGLSPTTVSKHLRAIREEWMAKE